ncbi:MAG: gas vesicle protein [bacterium]
MSEPNHSINATGLADILERVLDKGIVIAGDIKISLADVELLTIKIRLLVCSVDKAMEMGINWWQEDTFLSSKAREKELMQQQESLDARLEKLESLNKPL